MIRSVVLDTGKGFVYNKNASIALDCWNPVLTLYKAKIGFLLRLLA
jgi:hypothetical protein